MVTMCGRCGHRVRVEVGVTEGRGVSVYFDDDRASESYAEHMASCPGCGQSLAGEGLQGSSPVAVSLTAHEIGEALGIPTEVARALVSSAAQDGGRNTK
jgi:hypothetical protein